MLSKAMTMILGIIYKKPINAYEIIKKLEEMNINSWYKIADSTVYATVKQANKKEYLSVKIVRDGEMPQKKIYSLTKNGENEIERTVESFISGFDYDIRNFNIGMFFSDIPGVDKTIKLLEKRIMLLKKYQMGIAEKIDEMKSTGYSELIIENTRQNLLIVEAQLKGSESILKVMKNSEIS
jgi:DNA-binding PadR family transcriptional regulator